MISTKYLLLIPILLSFTAGLNLGYTSELKTNKGKSAGSGNLHVLYENERLTIRVIEAELKSVLQKIAREADLEVRMTGLVNEKVSLSIEKLPLEEALKRLLKNQNYAFTYSSKEKETNSDQRNLIISRVDILEKSNLIQNGKKLPRDITDTGSQLAASPDLKSKDALVEWIRDLPMQDSANNEQLNALVEVITNNQNIEKARSQIMDTLEKIESIDNENIDLDAVRKMLRSNSERIIDSEVKQ